MAETLLHNLTKFHRATSLEDLQKQFRELADAFFFGGYINVRDQYCIYPRTIEFYYHDEETTNKDLQDPIVYHRNRHGRVVPPFPIGTIHAHASGLDITFEDPNGKYRASALIRAYTVLSFVEKDYLKCFIAPKHGVWTPLSEEERKNPSKNICKQSTYLYDLLNGFTFGQDAGIKWYSDEYIHDTELVTNKRQNVYVYEPDGKGDWIKTKNIDERKWSFSKNSILEPGMTIKRT